MGDHLVDHLDDLDLCGAHFGMVEELVRADDVEQAAVDLLKPDHLADEREQQLPIGFARQSRSALRGRLEHPLRDHGDNQVLLGREVTKQSRSPDSGEVGNLADSDLDPALAEHLAGRLQQSNPVPRGVGALVPRGSLVSIRIAADSHIYKGSSIGGSSLPAGCGV